MIRIAAAHLAPAFMDAEASARKAADWIARAGADRIALVVFPEVFLPGFPYWINLYPPLAQAGLNRRYQDAAIELEGPEVAIVADAARTHGVAVVIGACERIAGTRRIYNSAILIDATGRIAGIHRKLKPTYAERYIWAEGAGCDLGCFGLGPARVGALICWEHMLNHARQALAEDGLEIHAALWPGLSTMVGFDQMADIQIEAMMRNHALTAQCFLACAGSPVTPEILGFLESELGPQQMMHAGGGWSALVNPFGLLVAGPVTGLAESLVVADIDLAQRADMKMWADTTGHYARPDVFRFEVNRSRTRTFLD